MKTKTLLIILLMLTCLATGQISHKIEIMSDGDADIESKILLNAENQVNYWQSSWNLPEGAKNLSIEDTSGDLDEIRIRDRTVYFNTSKGELRNEELVTIRYQIPEKAEKIEEKLYRSEFQLSGFKNADTSVQIKTPKKLLGTYESYGFKSSTGDRTANFSGKGAVNIRATWTPREGDYNNYILFGDANLTRADNIYPVLNMLTGRKVDFRKFAVIIVPDDEYMEEHNSWFAGTYENGATIFIKRSEVEKNSFTGLLIHETMHGFNQRPLRWVGTNSSVFDEGTAKYAEFLVNHNLGVRQAEIFGEPVKWTGPCEDNPRKECAFRIGTRGKPEHLWNYYQENNSFMKSWNPSITQNTGDISIRSFGYAYGELLIREELMRKDEQSLKHIYDRMKETEKAESYNEYWESLEDIFETDMMPCYPNTRTAFERCLEDINSMEPELPENITLEGENYSIMFQPIMKEEVEEPNYTDQLEKKSDQENFWEKYFKYLKNLLNNLFS